MEIASHVDGLREAIEIGLNRPTRPGGADRVNPYSGVLGKSPLFSGLSAADIDTIFRGARVKEFTRGQVVHLEGGRVEQVLLLSSGFIKRSKITNSGSEVILRLDTPGDLLGAEGLLSDGTHCTGAQAFRLCRTWVWDAEVFRESLEHFPVLSQKIVAILDRRLLELEERFREVATERVGPRVARQLLRLLDQLGRTVKGGIEIRLSREEVAQMTGTTLFTVSRLFSAWESRAMLIPRREAVIICDVQLLRAVSEDN